MCVFRPNPDTIPIVDGQRSGATSNRATGMNQNGSLSSPEDAQLIKIISSDLHYVATFR